MAISAAQVKELREMTGLGMMECKQALVEASGDKDAAVEILRKKAGAKVEKKASRIAADGAVSIAISDDRKSAAMVEVNSETDFVAKDDGFLGFVNAVAQCALDNKPADNAALESLPMNGGSVASAREALVAKMGENMAVRRFIYVSTSGHLASYIHGRKIGVVVDMEGGSEDLAKDIAMHVAANKPEYVMADQVPADVIDKEREIFIAQAKESGKPDNIIEKMVVGQINKFLAGISLMGQSFVKDPDQTVEKLLNSASAKVNAFYRFEVGEGIEKKKDDFAAEVMAQAKGN